MEALNIKKMSDSRARFALIDADSVLYAVALQAEACIKGRNGAEDEYMIVKDGEECYREVVRRLEALVQEIGAEDALVCLTPAGKCFRYTLLPSYKANRATMRRPAMLRPLQSLVAQRKPFRTLAVWGLEADDVCGISSTSLQRANLREPVIVSIDKDMQQIPGLNYSPMSAARTGTIGEVHEITPYEGERCHFYQTLVGDVVDNYTGCPGLGPKKAGRLLDECVETQGCLDWSWIVGAFKRKGLTEEYALTQARVARILQDKDWNPKLKEVKLWQPNTTRPSVSAPTANLPSASFIELALKDVPSKIILDERKGATLH